MDAGVITLPAEFFCQERVVTGGDANSTIALDITGTGEDNMWIRFSVAKVDDAQVRKVCERLAESEKSFGWDLEAI